MTHVLVPAAPQPWEKKKAKDVRIPKGLATIRGKVFAIAALWERRKNVPQKIDNASLPAYSAMYFYCISCGHLADTLPENYTRTPKQLCTECQSLKDLGWLNE